jgi:hypothetical protein
MAPPVAATLTGTGPCNVNVTVSRVPSATSSAAVGTRKSVRHLTGQPPGVSHLRPGCVPCDRIHPVRRAADPAPQSFQMLRDSYCMLPKII